MRDDFDAVYERIASNIQHEAADRVVGGFAALIFINVTLIRRNAQVRIALSNRPRKNPTTQNKIGSHTGPHRFPNSSNFEE